MLDASDMNKLFSRLAPEFLAYLESQKAAIEKEVRRLKRSEEAASETPAAAEERVD